jgi:hypothetical protein
VERGKVRKLGGKGGEREKARGVPSQWDEYPKNRNF